MEDKPDEDVALPGLKCISSRKPNVIGMHGWEFFMHKSKRATKYGKAALDEDETAEIHWVIETWSLDDLLSKFRHAAIEEGVIDES